MGNRTFNTGSLSSVITVDPITLNLGIGGAPTAYKANVAGAVAATNFVLNGATGNTGIYYGHTDRVVLANYTAGGIDFEVNGGAISMTLFPTGNLAIGTTPTDAGYKLDVIGTGRFSGALSGTSATFSSTNATLNLTTNGAAGAVWGQYTTNGGTSIVGGDNAAGSLSGGNSYCLFIGAAAGRDIVLAPNNVKALTLASTGAATFSSGIGIGNATATTGGIQFPATEVNINNANNLDDYEEGSFTPIVIGSDTAGTATYNAAQGRYTKVGRIVTFNLYIDWSSGTGSGVLRISNLPFTASDAFVYPAVTIGETGGISASANNIMTARINPSSNQVFISQYPVGGGAASSVFYDSAGYFVLAGTYYV